MTKLDKIEEIIREYENGVDSSIDASDILEGIKNVLDDPIFTIETSESHDSESETLRIDSPAGELCAYVGADPDNPAVGIYLMPKDGNGTIVDLAYAEVKGKELTDISKEQGEDIGYEDVSLYTYADPYTEEFTQKNVVKRNDIVKALEIDDDISGLKEDNHKTQQKENAKSLIPYILETSYETDNIIAISEKPNGENRYMFFHYMPIDISAEAIAKVQLIPSELRDKFIALYEQFQENHDECEETPLEFIEGDEWTGNSETMQYYDGYKDILNALLNDSQFFTFIKECVCAKRNFEDDLKEHIDQQYVAHNDFGYAITAAEQLGYNNLIENTKQRINNNKGKEKTDIIRK